jgi:acetylornithine/N-succinyldiaminopimelate aminotransferase
MNQRYSWDDLFQKSYATPEITLISGKGLVVVGSDGKKYLDFIGGIATNVIGHAHPKVIKAVTDQIKTLGHVSNLYANVTSMQLAAKLIDITQDKDARIFFCNSGAEANEAALKLSRKSSRNRIVATEGSFHGRTTGALSMTGQASKREPFLPLLSKVKHVPYGDISAMRRVVSRKTAMVIVEPIMGEAGIICPPDGYLRELRELCNKVGAILVFDCVQTGMGRTGQWFGFEHEGVQPDVITLAKGLGAGLPLAAMIVLGSCASRFAPGEHGTTFGGNPVSAAAGCAAIEVIEKEKLMKKALHHEKNLKKNVSALAGVSEVRGRGLLIGIELRSPSAIRLSQILAHKGVLVNAANPTTIRIAPALTVTDLQISKFISIFSQSLQELLHELREESGQGMQNE